MQISRPGVYEDQGGTCLHERRRAGTRWFLDQTETGKVMMAAGQAMRDQAAPQPMWFYLIPGDR